MRIVNLGSVPCRGCGCSDGAVHKVGCPVGARDLAIEMSRESLYRDRDHRQEACESAGVGVVDGLTERTAAEYMAPERRLPRVPVEASASAVESCMAGNLPGEENSPQLEMSDTMRLALDREKHKVEMADIGYYTLLYFVEFMELDNSISSGLAASMREHLGRLYAFVPETD